MRKLLLSLLFVPYFGFAQSADIDVFKEYRRTLVAQLLTNPRSPLDSQSIYGLRYFAENDSFRFPTIILPLTETEIMSFATSDGKAKEYIPYARIFFRFGESMHELTVYESIALRANPLYKNKLFLPFWDETNGFESYGGGRYLDIERKDIDDRSLVLDFNKAYNPWCAYSDSFSCPIPPAQNRLSIAIRAGEAAYVTAIKLEKGLESSVDEVSLFDQKSSLMVPTEFTLEITTHPKVDVKQE